MSQPFGRSCARPGLATLAPSPAQGRGFVVLCGRPRAVVETVKRVWRVRGWVRAISVAIPALFLSLSFVWPGVLNPTWTTGMPADQAPAVGVFGVASAICIWSAFRSRLVLRGETFTVVNPWRRRTGQVENVERVTPGDYGTEIHLKNGRRIIVFAVQCTWAYWGEPRWVGVATALTGREPPWRPDDDDSTDPADFPCAACGHDDFYHPSTRARELRTCAACVWEEDIGRREPEDMCARRYTGRGRPLCD